MPATTVYFYAEGGHSPVVEWLTDLNAANARAFDACAARIALLAALGHELRRPHADYLRDGVYELRAKVGRRNYRLLYFFHGKDIAVIAHALTKEAAVPNADIDRALVRKARYEQSPKAHRASLDL